MLGVFLVVTLNVNNLSDNLAESCQVKAYVTDEAQKDPAKLTEIENAIKDGEKEFGVTLTKEQKELVFSVVEKVKKLGIDPQFLVDQAEEIYKKYSNEIKNEVNQKKQEIVEEVQEKVKEEISRSLTDYVSDMVKNVTSFFKGIFKR